MSDPQTATDPAAAADEEVDRLRTALADARARIERACARVGRDPAGVGILAVSKTVPVERLRAALELGVTTFGENRVQEAESKVELVPGASWELVGRLQSNKAARAIDLFDAIHSVDSLDLAERLDRLAREKGRAPYPVYIQVNIDADPEKSGLSESAVVELAQRLAALPGLEIRGLMTVGRLADTAEESRPTFRALRQLSERLRSREPQLGTGLSMGMSDDFEVAVEEGATLIRLGRALFGERPSP